MAPHKHSKSTTARRSTAALDCAEATSCIRQILRITAVAGTSRRSEISTRNRMDLTELGALMDSMQIDTSATELEEMFRDMDINDEL
ncbi:hypothetical protein RUND412_003215 [Rhizina undulata]